MVGVGLSAIVPDSPQLYLPDSKSFVSNYFPQYFLDIGQNTKINAYSHRDLFGRSNRYLTQRKGLLNTLQFYYLSAEKAPITLYFEKGSKKIFMLEVKGYKATEREQLRWFLKRNQLNVGGLEQYLGKSYTRLLTHYPAGEICKESPRQYLNYCTNFGSIYFILAPSRTHIPVIVGFRVCFKGDDLHKWAGTTICHAAALCAPDDDVLGAGAKK